MQAQERADALCKKQLAELERLSGLTSDEAKQELLQSLEDEVKHESAMLIKDLEQQSKGMRLIRKLARLFLWLSNVVPLTMLQKLLFLL